MYAFDENYLAGKCPFLKIGYATSNVHVIIIVILPIFRQKYPYIHITIIAPIYLPTYSYIHPYMHSSSTNCVLYTCNVSTLSLLLIVSTKFSDFLTLGCACINFSKFLSHA